MFVSVMPIELLTRELLRQTEAGWIWAGADYFRSQTTMRE